MKLRSKLVLLATFCALAVYTLWGPGSEHSLGPHQNSTGNLQEYLGIVEHCHEHHYTMVDEEGNLIMQTARQIFIGNKYHTQDNRLYEVIRVEGDKAIARFVKEIDLSGRGLTAPSIAAAATGQPVQGENEDRVIGIYHTHGAESYVPTDGSESIVEGGGILNVGEVFAQSLEDLGIRVLHSQETHVPHDAGAYNRSRRTFEEMLQENPDALFDVHRDAVPAEAYAGEVEGQPVAQIQFVVGQQNQNQATIQDFAENLKAVGDELHPGLIKGIFYARGDYNQDLSPRAMLLEVGTHESSREDAEQAVQLFAETASTFLYGEEAPIQEARQETAGTASRSIIWLILGAALAGGIYLYLATGSWDKAVDKLRQFTKTEFANFLGRRPKAPRRSDDQEPPSGSDEVN